LLNSISESVLGGVTAMPAGATGVTSTRMTGRPDFVGCDTEMLLALLEGE
jgi:hypothetical protein